MTAAAVGGMGQLCRDPFAMLPFCGYNMADYWGPRLKIGEKADRRTAKVHPVNWFRKDEDGKFIWPGFGENSRVLAWIIERVEGALTPSRPRSAASRRMAICSIEWSGPRAGSAGGTVRGGPGELAGGVRPHRGSTSRSSVTGFRRPCTTS